MVDCPYVKGPVQLTPYKVCCQRLTCKKWVWGTFDETPWPDGYAGQGVGLAAPLFNSMFQAPKQAPNYDSESHAHAIHIPAGGIPLGIV